MGVAVPLPNPGKSKSLRSVHLRDFRGGVASRNGDSLDIADNELREAINVVLQETGGISSRGAFEYSSTINAGISNVAAKANLGDVYFAADAYFGSLSGGTTNTAGRYLRTGSNCGNDWISFMPSSSALNHFTVDVNNSDVPTVYRNFTTAMTGTGPTFQDSFSSPSGSYFPKCLSVCVHQGYMFAGYTYVAAGTLESPRRVRFSHPGDPGSWRTNDYLEFDGYVNGLASIGEQLVVFCDTAVYVVRGYSAETFAITKIANNGIPNRRSWAVTNDNRVFWMNQLGVFTYDGSTVQIISDKIKNLTSIVAPLGPICFTRAPRPMLIIPFTATNVWVFFADIGAWVKWSFGSIAGSVSMTFVGNVNGYTEDDQLYLFNQGYVSKYDPRGTQDNVWNNGNVNVATSFTTRWVDADSPEVKKTWKRPEVLYRSNASASLTITSYVDYVDTTDKTLTLSNAGSGSNYEIDKLQSLGPARSVSLKVAGPTGSNVYWSIEDIILKYRPKPLRN